MVGGVLCFCKAAVGVFYSPSWLGNLSVSAVWYVNCTSAERYDPSMRPHVGCGWQPVMPDDRMLLVERSEIWVLRGHVTGSTPLWPLLGLDGWSERSDLINRLVMSSPSTNMINKHKNPFYSIDAKHEGQQYWEKQKIISTNISIISENYFYQYICTHEIKENYFYRYIN